MSSKQWLQIRFRRMVSAPVAGLLVSCLLSLCVVPPAAGQNVSDVRRFGAGALSQEQRYQMLVISTDEIWKNALKTHKDFIERTNPELMLKTLRDELNEIRTQAKEKNAPVQIRKDVEQLKQEIDTLMKEGRITVARLDIAAKSQLLKAALERLEEELDTIVHICALTSYDSSTWEKDYVLSIQVQGEDVARRELKNQGLKAFDKLEIAWERSKKTRPTSSPAPQKRERPVDLGELSVSQLQAFQAEESALPVPDKAWLREISAEIKARLFASSSLEKFQEAEAAADAAEKEKAEKKRAEQSKSKEKDTGKRSPRAP